MGSLFMQQVKTFQVIADDSIPAKFPGQIGLRGLSPGQASRQNAEFQAPQRSACIVNRIAGKEMD
jgi:hypothetical protein